MPNWKEYGNPFLDFTEELTQKWISKGFDKEQTKEWQQERQRQPLPDECVDRKLPPEWSAIVPMQDNIGNPTNILDWKRIIQTIDCSHTGGFSWTDYFPRRSALCNKPVNEVAGWQIDDNEYHHRNGEQCWNHIEDTSK